MVNTKNSIFLLTSIGTCLLSSAANAFTINPLPGFTDSQFNNLLISGQWNELFVAESRGGNNALTGDQETVINPAFIPDGLGGLVPALPNPLAEGQTTWTNGTPVDFSLTYNSSSHLVTYTVGTETLSSVLASPNPLFDPNGLYLRTRATAQDSVSSSSMVLQNLLLDDGSGFLLIGSLSSSSGSAAGEINYLNIANLNSSFTLKGQQVLSWSGAFPTGSKLAAQIKVGGTPFVSTPEPTAWLGLTAIAAFGASAMVKKRRTNSF